jgi:hypothetical protein
VLERKQQQQQNMQRFANLTTEQITKKRMEMTPKATKV